jgi:predicted flavoprotein YhiN
MLATMTSHGVTIMIRHGVTKMAIHGVTTMTKSGAITIEIGAVMIGNGAIIVVIGTGGQDIPKSGAIGTDGIVTMKAERISIIRMVA